MYRSIRFIALFLVLIMATSMASAQGASFQIPITISASAVTSPVLTPLIFGVNGDDVGPILDNTYMQDLGTAYGPLGSWREASNPPDPMTFDYITKWIAPAAPWTIATGSRPYDFRGWTSATQVDEYKINVYGDGTTSQVSTSAITFTWSNVLVQLCTDVPGGSCKLLKNTGGTTYVEIADMRAVSSVTDDNASSSNNIKYLIVKTGAVTPPAVKLTVAPASLDFGSLAVGGSATQTLTVTNSGISTTLAGTIAVGGAFSVSPASISLAPLASTTVSVTFNAPLAAGVYSDNVVFTTNDPASPKSVPVTGTSVGPLCNVAPASLAFGTIMQNSGGANNKTMSLTVTNPTIAPLAGTLALTGAGASGYILSTTTLAVAPGGTQVINVTLSSVVEGVYVAAVSIAHNGVNASPVTVALTGEVMGQGGTLVLGGPTVVLDASSSDAGYYDNPIIMQSYAGQPFAGVQFTLITKGHIVIHKISKAGPVANNNWELTTNVIRGQKNEDGSTNDTVYVVLHSATPALALPVVVANGATLLDFRFDVMNIEGHSVATQILLRDIKGATAAAEDAFLNLPTQGYDQNITINNRTLKGDVNQDDQIDILDVLAIVNHIVKKVILTGEAFTDANIMPWASPDAVVDVQDLVKLQGIIMDGFYPGGLKIEESLDGINKLAKASNEGVIRFHITPRGITVVGEFATDFRGMQVTFTNISVAPKSVTSKVMSEVLAQLRSDNTMRFMLYDKNAKYLPAGVYMLADMPMQLLDYEQVGIQGLVMAGANSEKMTLRVEQVNYDAPQVPSAWTLNQNYPNPFNPATKIEFTVMDPSQVRITVYNLLGQEIRTLVNEQMTRGTQSVTWDGKDAAGRTLASGTYIYRMQAGSFVETKKMMLLK